MMDALSFEVFEKLSRTWGEPEEKEHSRTVLSKKEKYWGATRV